jgi:hypothetical protein
MGTLAVRYYIDLWGGWEKEAAAVVVVAVRTRRGPKQDPIPVYYGCPAHWIIRDGVDHHHYHGSADVSYTYSLVSRRVFKMRWKWIDRTAALSLYPHLEVMAATEHPGEFRLWTPTHE